MKSPLSVIAVPALALGLLLAVAPTALGADPVAERTQGFRASQEAVERIRLALSQGDMPAIAERAETLSAFAAHLPGLFPPGSGQGGGNQGGGGQGGGGQGGGLAKDAIWLNFADFETQSRTLEIRAKYLAYLAANGSDRNTRAKIGAAFVNVTDSCNSCHKAYRDDRRAARAE